MSAFSQEPVCCSSRKKRVGKYSSYSLRQNNPEPLSNGLFLHFPWISQGWFNNNIFLCFPSQFRMNVVCSRSLPCIQSTLIILLISNTVGSGQRLWDGAQTWKRRGRCFLKGVSQATSLSTSESRKTRGPWKGGVSALLHAGFRLLSVCMAN